MSFYSQQFLCFSDVYVGSLITPLTFLSLLFVPFSLMLSLSPCLFFSSPIGGLQIRYDSSGSLPGPGLLGTGGSGEMMPPVATSIEQLLERQWNEGQNFLMQQGTQGDGEETHSQQVLQRIATNLHVFFLRFASFLTFYQLIRCPLAFHLMPFATCLAPSRQSISHFICYCSICRSLSVICLSKVSSGALILTMKRKAVQLWRKVTVRLEESGLGLSPLLI